MPAFVNHRRVDESLLRRTCTRIERDSPIPTCRRRSEARGVILSCPESITRILVGADYNLLDAVELLARNAAQGLGRLLCRREMLSHRGSRLRHNQLYLTPFNLNFIDDCIRRSDIAGKRIFSGCGRTELGLAANSVKVSLWGLNRVRFLQIVATLRHNYFWRASFRVTNRLVAEVRVSTLEGISQLGHIERLLHF